MQSFGRDALSITWSSSRAELDIERRETKLRGKFYDEYREKREAKLREENAAKKAENELAKLKAMQEILELRKAEMAGKSDTKSPEKRDPSAKAQPLPQKLQSPPKSRLSEIKKEQNKTSGDEGHSTNDLHKGSFHQKSTFNRRAPGELCSPISTPRVSLDLSKTTGIKKISSKNTSSAISRTSKPLILPSPTSAKPKVSGTSNHLTNKQENQTLMGEKSLSQSVSNLADKEENPKALSGLYGSNPTFEKLETTFSVQNKHSSHSKSGNETSHLDVNGSHSGSPSSHSKEEKKNYNQTRKGLLDGSVNSEESALTSKPSFYSKVTKKSSVAPMETKPFLRKGSGIGPGSSRIASKMKASSFSHSPKDVGNEVQFGEENTKQRVKQLRNPEQSNIIKGDAEDKEPDQSVNDTVQIVDVHDDLFTSEQNKQTMPALNKISVVSKDCVYQNAISGNDMNMPTVSNVSNVSDFPSKLAFSSPITNPGHKQEIASSSKIAMNEENVEPSPAATILYNPMPLIHPHFNPSGLQSELVKPTSSKSDKHSLSQLFEVDTDAEQAHQRCGSAQNPILVTQHSQKDAPKGLKKFLNFARKSRSKNISADSISASILPEGDEVTDKLKQYPGRNVNEVLQRDQAQAKGIIPGNPSFYKSCDFESVNSSVHSSQSAILRDERLTGATLRKGPHSLFALSPFRSKGSNSKAQ